MSQKPDQPWEIKKIRVDKLSLWDENSRFPEEYFTKSEKILIEYFIKIKKKELKIESLIKEIVREFDLPQLENIVVLKLNGKNIVIEGNRRVVAYKLLINPLLGKPYGLEAFLEGHKKQTKINDNFTLESNVTTNKDQALRYVDRKHNRGNNEVAWGEPERRNFAIRREYGKSKDYLRVDLANAVKNLPLVDSIKETVLGTGYVTTFYRIADSGAARAKLGYTTQKDGHIQIKDQNKFNDFLKIIAYQVWTKQDFSHAPIDSRSLNKTKAIENYIKNLNQKDVKRVDQEIAKNTKTDMYGGKTVVASPKTRSKPISVLRKHLITSSIYIPDRRINDIYNELKTKLEVDITPNAVAVLFRVFIECSVDYYIHQNKIPIKDDIQLAGKVLKVVEHLENILVNQYLLDNGIKKPTANDVKKAKEKVKIKEARKLATKDNNSILSVSTFHDFVHDYKTSPIPSELKKHWENLDNFFEMMWKHCTHSGQKK